MIYFYELTTFRFPAAKIIRMSESRKFISLKMQKSLFFDSNYMHIFLKSCLFSVKNIVGAYLVYVPTKQTK